MSSESDHQRDRQETVSKNIESIIKLEDEDERQLSFLYRASHKIGFFVGTVYFVLIQMSFVVLWIIWNVSAKNRFDPYPFNLISAVLALEAVLLTAFVLIRQNSMDVRSERRNHLDLQINLLAEKEASSILHKLDAIAKKLEVDLSLAEKPDDTAKDTQIESIARDLNSKKRKAST